MKPIIDMETIQIEITNLCHNKCSNCTRLVGHHPKPYFMDFETFRKAVDSLADYPRMVGMMGGEPLLHPQFEQFCQYLSENRPTEKCGLWTCFPKGKEHYRETICKTFGHIFLNDHSREDILHGPVLVSQKELKIESWFKDYLTNICWVQNFWSASINPNGAFFCEVAASLSMLFDKEGESLGWDPNSEWWKKAPKDYVEQMARYCATCGCAMPLKKRESIDGRDDISPSILKNLKDIGSPKVAQGKYVEHDLSLENDQRRTASYKEKEYRDEIASRYGIFLMINENGYQTPNLKQSFSVGKDVVEDAEIIEKVEV